MDQCRIVPSDALVSRVSSELAWMMLGCSLVSIGFVAFALALPLIDPGHASLAVELLCIAVFGSLATLSRRSYRPSPRQRCGQLRRHLVSTAKRRVYLIAWCDVANVNADDTQQRLVLSDATGDRSIRLEYQLENFGRLREFVLSHAAAPTHLHASGTNVFHRTWINKGILLSGTTCFFLLHG